MYGAERSEILHAAAEKLLAARDELAFHETLESGKPFSQAGFVVTGYGDPVGQALCGYRDVEMISFTGSTKVGKAIARAAADNLKKV